jgi:hypothetical protein
MITTRLCCRPVPIPVDKAAKILGVRNGWIRCLDLAGRPLGSTCDPLGNILNSYSEGVSSLLPFPVIRLTNQYFILEPPPPPCPPTPPLRPYTQTLSLKNRSTSIYNTPSPPNFLVFSRLGLLHLVPGLFYIDRRKGKSSASNDVEAGEGVLRKMCTTFIHGIPIGKLSQY